jgi:uncharacterized protein (TIGR02266 family)
MSGKRDDGNGKAAPGGFTRVPTGQFRTTTPREPRAAVVVPVRCRYDSIIDFVETQSMNVSKSGIFVATPDNVAVGSAVDFEVTLADGFQLLKGKAEVARVSQAPRGLGLRFTQLDPASTKLIARIVEVNAAEGKKPTVSMDFAPAEVAPGPGGGTGNARGFAAPSLTQAGGVTWKEQEVSVQLNPITVSYFVYNPLLNIRLGGFVVPAEREVPLGTLFSVTITTVSGESLFSGKGKVVAKHEKRLGIRLVDVEKAVLSRLQAEVNRLVPSK